MKYLTLSRRRAVAGYLFILPWIIGFAVFLAYPLGRSLIMSFQELESLSGFVFRWVGFDNIRALLFVDTQYLPALGRTLRNVVLDLPVILVFSLFVAFLVTRKLPGSYFFKAIFFLPVVIASGVVVERLFSQGVGVADSTIPSLSIAGTYRLAELLLIHVGPGAANIFLDVVNRLTMVIWRSGVQILLFIAGLQGISPTLYEAAEVDGASDWEVFWKVTLPLLSPILVVNVVFTVVDSFTDIFNELLEMIRNVAFHGSAGMRMGYASAMGWIYFVLIFIALLVFLRWSRRWVFYVGEK
jgi:ABC-type sugar transport system permease subunit